MKFKQWPLTYYDAKHSYSNEQFNFLENVHYENNNNIIIVHERSNGACEYIVIDCQIPHICLMNIQCGYVKYNDHVDKSNDIT